MSLLKFYLKVQETEEQILRIGASLCIATKIQTPSVCAFGMNLLGAEMIKVMRTMEINTAEVCYFLLGDDSCDEAIENPTHLWTVPIPLHRNPPVQRISFPIAEAPKLKVLHLTDTHLDPLYVEGSNAVCAEPMCCRSGDKHGKSFKAAGKWGDYRCDVPKCTFVHLLDHISETHKVRIRIMFITIMQ